MADYPARNTRKQCVEPETEPQGHECDKVSPNVEFQVVARKGKFKSPKTPGTPKTPKKTRKKKKNKDADSCKDIRKFLSPSTKCKKGTSKNVCQAASQDGEHDNGNIMCTESDEEEAITLGQIGNSDAENINSISFYSTTSSLPGELENREEVMLNTSLNWSFQTDRNASTPLCKTTNQVLLQTGANYSQEDVTICPRPNMKPMMMSKANCGAKTNCEEPNKQCNAGANKQDKEDQDKANTLRDKDASDTNVNKRTENDYCNQPNEDPNQTIIRDNTSTEKSIKEHAAGDSPKRRNSNDPGNMDISNSQLLTQIQALMNTMKTELKKDINDIKQL